MPLTDLRSGDFVRIRWANGSELAGYVHVAGDSGIVSLQFGPENEPDSRWIALGFVGKAHPFVADGTLERIAAQGKLF